MGKISRAWMRAILIAGVILLFSSCTFLDQLLGTGTSPTKNTPLSSTKDITSFAFASLNVTAAIDSSAYAISATVLYGTDVTHLIADFTTTGASVTVKNVPQISGTTQNDFTNPVTYTVTAADSSTNNYVITVTVQAPSHDASLSNAVLVDSLGTTYAFVPTFSPTTYTYTDVSPATPSGGNPTFTLTLTTTDPHATITSVQENAIDDAHTGSAYTLTLNSYRNTVTILVTAQDATTTQTYTMAITAGWRG